LALAVLAHTAYGQLTMTTVASTSNCDGVHTAFTSLGYPHVNLGGSVVFRATTCPGGGIGIYVASVSGGPVEYVAATPTGFQDFTDYPAINDNGAIAFLATSYATPTWVQGVYTATPTTLTKVATQSFWPGPGFQSFGDPDSRVRINGNGQVLFCAWMWPDASHLNSTLALWRWTPGVGLEVVARQGDAIDGGTVNGINAWDLNGDGTIGFWGSYLDGHGGGGDAVWRGKPGSMALVLTSPIPDWGYYPTVFINQLGDLALNTNEQVPTGGTRDSWVIETAPPAVNRIWMASGGKAAPGTGGAPFFFYCDHTGDPARLPHYPSINYGKQGILHAGITSGLCIDDETGDGFWSWDGTNLHAEAIRGQSTVLWGGPGTEVFTASDSLHTTVAINDMSQIAFLSNVTSTAGDGIALFARNGTSMYRIASALAPETLWFGQGPYGITVTGNDNLNSGYARLSDCGYLVYRYDGSGYQKIVLARMGNMCVLPLIGPPEE
jgi:hypothetical protein